MVDAFIPLIYSIELEVENVDDLVTGMNTDSDQDHASASSDLKPPSSRRWFWRPQICKMWTSRKASPLAENLGDKESGGPLPTPSARHRLRFTPFAIVRWCQRVPSKLKATMQLVHFVGRRRRPKPSSLMQTLLKMSHTRRRVVHLARLLAPKSEIIGHLRRRLAAGELSTHLGDVQGIPSIAVIVLELTPR
jgi:Mg2+ and Co2+ transporter CorA